MVARFEDRLRLRLAAIRFPVDGDLGGEPQPHAAALERQTITRGMEFGVSPMPETRRRMMERGRMFDTPCFRWIPAKSRVGAVPRRHRAGREPPRRSWPGTTAGEVRFV
jgi:hypothetical protein